jgi:hypothetical protein
VVSVNWETISKECQQLVAASNNKENKARIGKEYTPSDQILIVMDANECRGQPKMSVPTKGPYTVTQVYPNGAVQINRRNFVETINIPRIKPYLTN